MTSLVNVTNDYIAGAHRFYTIGSGTSNDNLTNFSIQPKYETVRIQDSNVFVTGSIYPTSCNVYDLGSSNYRWRDLYLSGNTIDLGGTRISRNNTTGGMKISSKVNDTPLDFTAQHITALGTLYASNITIGGNALIIGDNGNVGMGTALPTQKLDVRGNIYASGNIVCSNISVIGDFVRLDTITSNTEQMVVENAGTGPALKVTQSGANSVAEFYDSESGVALFVGNNGNIGIGTNAPLAKLHVNDTGAMIIPSGTSEQIPTIGILGMIRFNTTLQKIQYYNEAGWASLGGVSALGGNTTIDLNGYRIHTFTSSSTFTVYSGGSVETLVVAGGGGGGWDVGGGGGAGGLIYNSSFIVPNGSYNIVVGFGGPGSSTVGASPAAYKGQNSSFSSLVAIGGGGGGNYASQNGGDGGSGGGASGYGNPGQPGNGTSGQGNRGGYANSGNTNANTGGGGGGAGGVGNNSIQNINSFVEGGIGLVYSISGSSVTYAQGGRGGGDSWTGRASGTANRGNGGDGGGNPNDGGAGGSGIVIIRYPI